MHPESIISQIRHGNIGPNNSYFADKFYTEVSGSIDSVYSDSEKNYILIKEVDGSSKTFESTLENKAVVIKGDVVNTGDTIYKGSFINNVFYIDMSRLLLLLLFFSICYLIFIAYRKRKKEGTL